MMVLCVTSNLKTTYTLQGYNMNDKIKILIVEDEIIPAMNLEVILKKNGFDTCGIAANNEQALTLYKTKHPDLVLMDIRLAKGPSGIATAREILTESPGFPIIFMTGYSDKETQSEALQLNPVSFQEKPLKIKNLINIINEYFE